MIVDHLCISASSVLASPICLDVYICRLAVHPRMHHSQHTPHAKCVCTAHHTHLKHCHYCEHIICSVNHDTAAGDAALWPSPMCRRSLLATTSHACQQYYWPMMYQCGEDITRNIGDYQLAGSGPEQRRPVVKHASAGVERVMQGLRCMAHWMMQLWHRHYEFRRKW